MTATVVLVVVLGLVVAGVFAALWIGERRRAHEVGNDPERLDPDPDPHSGPPSGPQSGPHSEPHSGPHSGPRRDRDPRGDGGA